MYKEQTILVAMIFTRISSIFQLKTLLFASLIVSFLQDTTLAFRLRKNSFNSYVDKQNSNANLHLLSDVIERRSSASASSSWGHGYKNSFLQLNIAEMNKRNNVKLNMAQSDGSPLSSTSETASLKEREELWKTISQLEKKAVTILSEEEGSAYLEDAYKLLAQSVNLKNTDPFLILVDQYNSAVEQKDEEKMKLLLDEMRKVHVPPHLASLAEISKGSTSKSSTGSDNMISGDVLPDDIDPGSTFSDTVTEKVRVKVSSFYDEEKSDPAKGKYMFWYKVAIYNEGPEPVQIVARMWEIEKCEGEKEVVRGAGIMSTQPIISPGDVFTYQSICPLKVFPPKGKRVLGSMSGAYTMCKGNMGQHNFTVKVSKFNLILPESLNI